MIYQIKTSFKKILSDTITPVSIYLKIRDNFPNSILLESSDYHGNENSFSYICFNPIASISVQDSKIHQHFPDGKDLVIEINQGVDVPMEIHNFSQKFEAEDQKFKFINNGLFGYISYDAVQFFEDISITSKENKLQIPEVYYAVYQNIIAINHFKNEAFIFCHSLSGKNNTDEIHQLIENKNFASYSFKNGDDEASSFTDNEYLELVEQAKRHCFRGDVFQLVLSRQFSQSFKGDEFNVYRALRSINPSPYLFYFDYGDFKIFGSSPEAQLVVKNGKAEIHPIAGTFRRTGNDEKDLEAAKALAKDEKENAEHVMLVDLARNDLSRNGEHVHVETYKEIQFFSHVIHLVSKVVGEKFKDAITYQVVADTFPAGTLTGAPKHRAMQLIDQYEKTNRTFYGGAIGFMDFKGNFNHAIIIRSFLSKNHRLFYQAGAGIVAKSDPKSELQEVYNKLGALKLALEMAEKI
ncbi:anthranilate synthase component I family protein [Namhaeicola litoreus]|uniref:Anthranilate synthase component 1 n=1 Tax=Namhaeicola litoreus TaxID=1052145 RepID=A0ABW3Y0A0_9FLAO